jgi:hypothetical protein
LKKMDSTRDTSKIGLGEDVDVPVGKGLQTSASW